jgi:transposase InsO family protein
MNMHKNARLTWNRRLEMVKEVIDNKMGISSTARHHGVSEPTVRKWVGRYVLQRESGLLDRSSRPRVSPRAISASQALAIVELRHQRLTQSRIAHALRLSAATVSRVLARAGLSKLSALDPVEPVRRYEHPLPGDLLHIDIKTLGRIVAVGHRITGNPRDHVPGVGYESVFVAVDDHSRIAFTQMQSSEGKDCAMAFLACAVRYYASLGVTIRRVLTDNGAAFRSKAFARACTALNLIHRFTQPYRPQTNGKAERFIQSALREWAYGFVYRHSDQRTAMLRYWTHHYNWHRPHMGIGSVPPISRLSPNNLLQLHTSGFAGGHLTLRIRPGSLMVTGLQSMPFREPLWARHLEGFVMRIQEERYSYQIPGTVLS